ncbi:hypothetical protein ACFL5U_03535 [Candidatus Margulisiibacteriota bacterium]
MRVNGPARRMATLLELREESRAQQNPQLGQVLGQLCDSGARLLRLLEDAYRREYLVSYDVEVGRHVYTRTQCVNVADILLGEIAQFMLSLDAFDFGVNEIRLLGRWRRPSTPDQPSDYVINHLIPVIDLFNQRIAMDLTAAQFADANGIEVNVLLGSAALVNETLRDWFGVTNVEILPHREDKPFGFIEGEGFYYKKGSRAKS